MQGIVCKAWSGDLKGFIKCRNNPEVLQLLALLIDGVTEAWRWG